jgi:AcrR family transcriptional regulator
MASKGRSAKGAERRDIILRTAFDVIAREGYQGATLGAIARELQLESPHLLYYFDNREELLREVLERWAMETMESIPERDDFLDYFRRAVHRDLTIRGVVHLYLSFATEAIDPAHPANAFFRERFAVATESLTAVLEAGQAAGSIRPEIDAGSFARILIATADGLQLQALLDPSIDAPADLDRAIDALFVSGHRESISAAWDPWTPRAGHESESEA